MSNTIVLIHGAWLTPTAWDLFKSRYEGRGYECITPAWPLLDRSVAELRTSPHPDFSALSIGKIVDHYESILKKLNKPPILMGHSFGGLFVQILLDRGFGKAGIAIASAPPKGIYLAPGFASLRSTMPVLLAWNGWKRTLTKSLKHFSRDFAQLLSSDEQQKAYQEYIVPAPGKIFFQNTFGQENRVNYKQKNRAPLLLIAGEADKTVQLSLVKENYRKYKHTVAKTDYKQFPYRTHWLIHEPHWEEVADYAIEWAEKLV